MSPLSPSVGSRGDSPGRAPQPPVGPAASRLDLSGPAWSGGGMTFDPALIAAARVSKAWPFEEARKLVQRYPQGK